MNHWHVKVTFLAYCIQHDHSCWHICQHSRGHICTNGTGEFILALVKDHLRHAIFIPQLQNLLVTPSTGGQWIPEDEEPPLPPASFCT